MNRIRIGILSTLIFGFVFVGLQLDTADAGIITSKKRFRRKASSKSALIRGWWGQQTRTFWEDTKKKRWKIYFAVIFSRRVNDLEVTVELYDVTRGRSKFLDSFSLWLAKRGEKSVTSILKLPRDDDGKFRANSKIQMRVVDGRKRTLARTWFKIKGKVKRHSGKVSFTVEETKGLPSGSKGLKAKAPEPKLSPKGSSECPAKGVTRLMVWGCGAFL